MAYKKRIDRERNAILEALLRNEPHRSRAALGENA
jgi:hypothetical protein